MADLGIGGDVHEEGADIDCVETFGGVLKNGIADVVDCRCKLVASDDDNHLVCVPCLT